MEQKKNGKEGIPDWAKGALFYQLFVDRFARGKDHPDCLMIGRNYRSWGDEVNWRRNNDGEFTNNDFYGGDLKGIKEKIPYFKLLGVDVLYLSPINFSTFRYDRYATSNHLMIDPDAGSFEDLKELHDEANKNGLHIILDIAFNHCSIDNAFYVDAVNNPNSQYRDWFKRDNDGNISFWCGFKDMPEFNQYSKGYQEYVYGNNGVVAKYAPYVDGFRHDLAEILEPFFLEGIMKQANKHSPHLIVGEFWKNPDPSLIGKGIDVPTSYPLTNAILKGVAYGEFEYLEKLTETMISEYPKEYLNSFLVSLDTHDIVRVLTILGRLDLMRTGMMDIWKIDDPPSRWHRDGKFYTDEFRQFEYDNDKLSDEQLKNAIELLRLAMVIQYFYIGSPCLYYGTEIGMQGFKDPFNRRCMDWTDEKNDATRSKLFNFVVQLGRFRKLFDFSNAEFPNIVARDSEVFCFTRKSGEHTLFVAVNRGKAERVLKVVPEEFKNEITSSLSFNCIGMQVLMPKGFLIIIK